jgi:hypothetical protein
MILKCDCIATLFSFGIILLKLSFHVFSHLDIGYVVDVLQVTCKTSLVSNPGKVPSQYRITKFFCTV